MSGEWDCAAYGSEGTKAGARCFFAELRQRLCGSEPECQDRLAAERSRLFGVIQDLAADGDPLYRQLAAEITDPGQLLGAAAADDR